jgi:hypothetical protein
MNTLNVLEDAIHNNETVTIYVGALAPIKDEVDYSGYDVNTSYRLFDPVLDVQLIDPDQEHEDGICGRIRFVLDLDLTVSEFFTDHYSFTDWSADSVESTLSALQNEDYAQIADDLSDTILECVDLGVRVDRVDLEYACEVWLRDNREDLVNEILSFIDL